jgi:hypothetical protein
MVEILEFGTRSGWEAVENGLGHRCARCRCPNAAEIGGPEAGRKRLADCHLDNLSFSAKSQCVAKQQSG